MSMSCKCCFLNFFYFFTKIYWNGTIKNQRKQPVFPRSFHVNHPSRSLQTIGIGLVQSIMHTYTITHSSPISKIMRWSNTKQQFLHLIAGYLDRFNLCRWSKKELEHKYFYKIPLLVNKSEIQVVYFADGKKTESLASSFTWTEVWVYWASSQCNKCVCCLYMGNQWSQTILTTTYSLRGHVFRYERSSTIGSKKALYSFRPIKIILKSMDREFFLAYLDMRSSCVRFNLVSKPRENWVDLHRCLHFWAFLAFFQSKKALCSRVA